LFIGVLLPFDHILALSGYNKMYPVSAVKPIKRPILYISFLAGSGEDLKFENSSKIARPAQQIIIGFNSFLSTNRLDHLKNAH
jgi:hypothetical protein